MILATAEPAACTPDEFTGPSPKDSASELEQSVSAGAAAKCATVTLTKMKERMFAANLLEDCLVQREHYSNPVREFARTSKPCDLLYFGQLHSQLR